MFQGPADDDGEPKAIKWKVISFQLGKTVTRRRAISVDRCLTERLPSFSLLHLTASGSAAEGQGSAIRPLPAPTSGPSVGKALAAQIRESVTQ